VKNKFIALENSANCFSYGQPECVIIGNVVIVLSVLSDVSPSFSETPESCPVYTGDETMACTVYRVD